MVNKMKIGNFNTIHENVTIGSNVQIGNYCMIEDGVVIGDNTIIKNYVELRTNTIIGKSCYIDSRVSTSGDCTIGNEVTLRYATIIARDVIIEDKVFMAPQCMTEYSDFKREKHAGTIIGSCAFIGTNTTISANIKICPGSVIARKSDINSDITTPGIYGSKDGKIILIREVPDDHWKDKILDKPRGWPCQECGRMLTERNSACPVSIVCNTCRRNGCPTLSDGKDYSTKDDIEFCKNALKD